MADEPSTPGEEVLTLERPAERSGRPRRRALWGALAVVAVAAGALAIGASRDDGRPPALPIALGSSTFETAGGAADAMLAWIRYEAGDELPALGGEGDAFRVRPAVTAEAVRELAAALGLEAEVVQDGALRRVPGPDGTLEVDAATGMWWYAQGVTDPGGSASTSASGGGGDPYAVCGDEPPGSCTVDWDRQVPPDQAVASCESADPVCTATTHPPELTCTAIGCPEPGDAGAESVEQCIAIYPEPAECIEPDGACTARLPDPAQCTEPVTLPEPVEPEPAPDLPSEADARRLALELLAAGGMDVDGAIVQVDGPYDAWYVVVEPVIGTAPVTGLTGTVSVGPGGTIVSAGGTMATTEAVGTYPLIDTGTAIDRLNDTSDVDPGVGIPAPADGAAGAAETFAPSAPGGAGAPATSPCDPGAAEDDPTACPDAGTGAEPPATTITTIVAVPCGGVPEDQLAVVGPCLSCATEPGTKECLDPAVPTTLAPELPSEPAPEPAGPLVVTLTGAERTLMVLPANDGSSDTYLVPGYRLSSGDGHVVEVVAVVDEGLAPAVEPETTAPPEPPATEPGVVEPAPAPGRSECEVLVEDDGSGTTHTVQTCPGEIPSSDPEVVHLSDGEQPELGVPYYVDVDVECGAFELGGQVWTLQKGDMAGWSTPHEGGTFTLETETSGTFRGDAQATKTATFATGIPANGCQPTPR